MSVPVTLKEVIKEFLKRSEMKKTSFCKHCDISITTLHQYFIGERNISSNAEARIRSFMAEYVQSLVELSKSN